MVGYRFVILAVLLHKDHYLIIPQRHIILDSLNNKSQHLRVKKDSLWINELTETAARLQLILNFVDCTNQNRIHASIQTENI